MASRAEKLRTLLLELLLRACALRTVRTVANRFALNKSLYPKAQVVRDVSAAVEAYYTAHKLEGALAAKQARTYQKVHFRQTIRRLRHQLEAEASEAEARRWRDLIHFYREQTRSLSRCDDSAEVIHHLARYYAEDMAAELDPAFFLAFKHIARRLFPKFVAGIRVSGRRSDTLHRVREAARHAPVLYVPNHVSNADHIPLCFALNRLGLEQPKIAAGANLFRGVSSRIMPRMNAYKIRREHIGAGGAWFDNVRWFQNPVYRRTHAAYLRHGWEHGEALLFYIEGTRSRTGSIEKPKLGILGESVQFVKATRREFYAVPVSLSYTVVPEDREIEASRNGADISNKDIVSQLAAMDRAYRSFDEAPIHVRFSDPLRIAEDVKVEDLAERLMIRIKEGVRLTDTATVAASILDTAESAPKGTLEFDAQAVRNRWEEAFADQPEFRGDSAERHLASGLRTLSARGFIGRTDAPEHYEVHDEALLQQYANRIAHRRA